MQSFKRKSRKKTIMIEEDIDDKIDLLSHSGGFKNHSQFLNWVLRQCFSKPSEILRLRAKEKAMQLHFINKQIDSLPETTTDVSIMRLN